MIKLISDENISWRLKNLIAHWEILPANEIKRGGRLKDSEIWTFAKLNGYSILTFDEDFSEIQNLQGFPPKVIWLRTGNITTANLTKLLRKLEDNILAFLADNDAGIYEIYF